MKLNSIKQNLDYLLTSDSSKCSDKVSEYFQNSTSGRNIFDQVKNKIFTLLKIRGYQYRDDSNKLLAYQIACRVLDLKGTEVKITVTDRSNNKIIIKFNKDSITATCGEKSEIIASNLPSGYLDTIKKNAEYIKKQPLTKISSPKILESGRRDLEMLDLKGATLKNANLENANLENANLRGADLRGAKLTNVNLRGADLTNADLTDANLENANLENANLRGADLTNAKLERAKLEKANLRRANLTNAKLGGAYLKNAKLEKANLTNANLERADLTNAKLEGVKLTGANLTNANLERADLTGANLEGVKLTGADLNKTTIWFANLTGADLTNAKLERANLRRANLTNANLERADLEGAELEKANLTGANLTNAKLEEADLEGAELEKANLTGANLTNANLERADLTGANLTNANLERANLTGANLEGVKLTNAKLTNAKLERAKITSSNLEYAKYRYANVRGAIIIDNNGQNYNPVPPQAKTSLEGLDKISQDTTLLEMLVFVARLNVEFNESSEIVKKIHKKITFIVHPDKFINKGEDLKSAAKDTFITYFPDLSTLKSDTRQQQLLNICNHFGDFSKRITGIGVYNEVLEGVRGWLLQFKQSLAGQKK